MLVGSTPLTECRRPHDHVRSMYVKTYSVEACRMQNVHHGGWLHDPLSFHSWCRHLAVNAGPVQQQCLQTRYLSDKRMY
jgi:hypothetical protein